MAISTEMREYATPEQVLDLMMRFWSEAAEDPRLGKMVAQAGTIVRLHFTDVLTAEGDPKGFTLYLDREPFEVVGGLGGLPESEVFASSAVWFALVRGQRRMAMAIAEGDITYTGPVRKFLRIVPILQNFDFDMWSDVKYERRTQDLGPPDGVERRRG